MKDTSIELNLDIIGGQGSLTQAEQIALSEYFKQKKQKNNLKKNSGLSALPKIKLVKV
jgi:hypothetical protein